MKEEIQKFFKGEVEDSEETLKTYITLGFKDDFNISDVSLSALSQARDYVNNYNSVQVNNRLNKISARVAHDIKSPLAVIEMSIVDILDKNTPKYKVIKNAIKFKQSRLLFVFKFKPINNGSS